MPQDRRGRRHEVRHRRGSEAVAGFDSEALSEARRAYDEYARLSEEIGSLRTELARLDQARQRAAAHVNKVLGKAKMPIGAAAAALGVPEQQLVLLAQHRRDHETRVCSFCAEQGPLVAGPDVNICWSCVPLVETVAEGREADPSVPMWAATADSHCSFCGKSPKQTTYLVQGLSATICNECIDLCEEIIAEGEISRP